MSDQTFVSRLRRAPGCRSLPGVSRIPASALTPLQPAPQRGASGTEAGRRPQAPASAPQAPASAPGTTAGDHTPAGTGGLVRSGPTWPAHTEPTHNVIPEVTGAWTPSQANGPVVKVSSGPPSLSQDPLDRGWAQRPLSEQMRPQGRHAKGPGKL